VRSARALSAAAICPGSATRRSRSDEGACRRRRVGRVDVLRVATTGARRTGRLVVGRRAGGATGVRRSGTAVRVEEARVRGKTVVVVGRGVARGETAVVVGRGVVRRSGATGDVSGRGRVPTPAMRRTGGVRGRLMSSSLPGTRGTAQPPEKRSSPTPGNGQG
jgi:hypothetical protein